MLMIVEPPHALAPRRLKPEPLLEPPDQVKVSHKHARHDRLLVAWGEDADEAEDEEEGEEVEFVAGAVVESGGRAERGEEVVGQFGGVGVEGRGEEGGDEGWGELRAEGEGD